MENKETGKPEEKVLRQEEFKVDCPRRIVVGDPSYFEEFSGERLKRLTASYTPPRFFEARVLLTEVEFSDFPGEKLCGMSVYMAPKETIETYVLYEAAVSLIGKNAEFGAVYEYYRSRKKNPLKKMQSVVAVACKVIRVFYAILTKGVDYDAEKMMGDIRRPQMQEA